MNGGIVQQSSTGPAVHTSAPLMSGSETSAVGQLGSNRHIWGG